MTRKEKQDRLAENLNMRPSTASIAVDMLEKQKEFLVAIARDEYNRGVADVLEIIDEVKSDVNNGYMFDMVDEIKNRVMDLKGEHQS